MRGVEFKSKYAVFGKQFGASGRNFGYCDGLLFFLTSTGEIAFVNVKETKADRGALNIRTVNGVSGMEMLFVSHDAVYSVFGDDTLCKYSVTPTAIVPSRQTNYLIACSISFVLQLKELTLVASVRRKDRYGTYLAFSIFDGKLQLLEELEAGDGESDFVPLNPVHTMKSIYMAHYRIILACRVKKELLVLTVSRRKLYLLSSKNLLLTKSRPSSS